MRDVSPSTRPAGRKARTGRMNDYCDCHGLPARLNQQCSITRLASDPDSSAESVQKMVESASASWHPPPSSFKFTMALVSFSVCASHGGVAKPASDSELKYVTELEHGYRCRRWHRMLPKIPPVPPFRWAWAVTRRELRALGALLAEHGRRGAAPLAALRRSAAPLAEADAAEARTGRGAADNRDQKSPDRDGVTQWTGLAKLATVKKAAMVHKVEATVPRRCREFP